MKNTAIKVVGVGVAIYISALFLSSVSGQTGLPSTQIHTGFASQNVDGASITAHRPGQFIQNSRNLPTHVRRGLLDLPNITATAPVDDPVRTAVLEELARVFLAAVQAVSLALQVAITGAATGT